MGDFRLTVDVAPHPVFTREGADLYVMVAISLQEALTGFERDITLLDGSVVTARWASSLGGREVGGLFCIC